MRCVSYLMYTESEEVDGYGYTPFIHSFILVFFLRIPFGRGESERDPRVIFYSRCYRSLFYVHTRGRIDRVVKQNKTKQNG